MFVKERDGNKRYGVTEYILPIKDTQDCVTLPPSVRTKNVSLFYLTASIAFTLLMAIDKYCFNQYLIAGTVLINIKPKIVFKNIQCLAGF